MMELSSETVLLGNHLRTLSSDNSASYNMAMLFAHTHYAARDGLTAWRSSAQTNVVSFQKCYHIDFP